MTLLKSAARIGKKFEEISEVTGLDPETVQLAVGIMLAGPLRLVGEYIKSEAFNSIAGEFIAQRKDGLANTLTAAAHNTSPETIVLWSGSEKINELNNSNIENKEESISFANDIQTNKQGAEFLINAAAGIIGLGAGKGASKGKDGGTDSTSSELNSIPDFVTRNDHDFSAKENYKGNPKAHINDQGDLVPPNIDGTGSIQSHIRGGSSENTPYISTTDPRFTQSSKDYGGQQINIDTKRLKEDIDAGKVNNTQIISHQQIRQELQSKVDAAQARFEANPNKKNEDRLKNTQNDLKNAIRDGECLIKGCVPSDYIKK